MKASDFVVAKFLKVVLAGQPGRGKSCSGMTFPLPMRIYDFDQKLGGPILFAKKQGIDLTKIDIFTVGSWRDLLVDMDRQCNRPEFSSYGFDSLTTMADLLLGQVQDNKTREKGKTKEIGGVPVPGLEEFNAESSGIMDVLLFMKTIKANIWLTAHVIETKGQVTDDQNRMRIVVNRSLLTGGKKAAAKIPAYFPENYSIQIEPPIKAGDTPRFFVHTTPNSEDYGRSEYPLPSVIEITNKKFYDTIMEQINKATGA